MDTPTICMYCDEFTLNVDGICDDCREGIEFAGDDAA